MILIDYLDYLLGVAFLSFVLFMFLKLYINIKNVYFSLKGVITFFLVFVTFPYSLTNIIYKKRKQLIKKIDKDTTLDDEMKVKLKKIVQSRLTLCMRLYKIHILDLPNFIELFSVSYKRVYQKRMNSKTKHKNNTKLELFGEIQKKISVYNTFDTIKEKYS
ncbi:hypothetical protein [Gracilibacillus thailandensis]|uniref:Uncharacterized protein n=1 Tax=Gracilibacillus thailandensis TaxID=563735 RepID=A0A6N7R5Y9_9BACI|nr:hypothetical protein [Gracilibacillus thailandensis]MRI68645.1 hypothetical protein [Gracilibacillus thailandensis]